MAQRATLAISNTQEQPPSITAYDPVFFPKEAVRLGIVLKCYGRRDPGSLWKVTHIHTYTKRPSGHYSLVSVKEVQRLGDLITIVRQGRDDSVPNRRQSSFGTLSYSAIWRLHT